MWPSDAKYVAGVPDGHQITVRQLLNMTSGLYNTTGDDALNTDLHALDVHERQREPIGNLILDGIDGVPSAGRFGA